MNVSIPTSPGDSILISAKLDSLGDISRLKLGSSTLAAIWMVLERERRRSPEGDETRNCDVDLLITMAGGSNSDRTEFHLESAEEISTVAPWLSGTVSQLAYMFVVRSGEKSRSEPVLTIQRTKQMVEVKINSNLNSGTKHLIRQILLGAQINIPFALRVLIVIVGVIIGLLLGITIAIIITFALFGDIEGSETAFFTLLLLSAGTLMSLITRRILRFARPTFLVDIGDGRRLHHLHNVLEDRLGFATVLTLVWSLSSAVLGYLVPELQKFL